MPVKARAVDMARGEPIVAGGGLHRRALLAAAAAAPVGLLGTLCTTGTARAAVSVDEIAVLFPGTVGYFETQLVGMRRAAQRLGGIALNIRWANWDAVTQLRQLEHLLRQGRLPMALCAADNLALIRVARMREALPAAGRPPLICFTNALGDRRDGRLEGIDAFVGRDEYEAGDRLVQLLQTRLPSDQPRRILLLEGSPGTAPQRMRSAGFLNAMRTRTRWELVGQVTAEGWRLSALEQKLRDRDYGDVDGVAAQWAGAATFAARYWARVGRKRPVIVGLEYDSSIRQAMLDGLVDGTVYHDIEAEGERVVETLIELARNGPGAYLFVPTQQRNVLAGDELLKRIVPGKT